ncbi:glycerophosphodiester phosphodiesterase [Cytobacillus purgationiresistens]|uniref:Glycerophosphoryl diester phosphodiesterase n=1 Tax=Cytobacillus purgationiresistens TaxID=863449 RepID=A0ABU0ARW1_9BACI|nr:glycerophosphodiester phosphodiesterase family protein [Cytobacillus purgationiresistens]MDQ0273923.1 glycerophosphoryl diester phosphodiesterase [Cytobacillus purgationiresistens]
MRIQLTKRKSLPLLLILCFLSFSIIEGFLPLHPFESIAHRGASNVAPENTMAAFEEALALDFDYIELDVHLSKDGEFIVIHDDTVDRTTNGEGKINEMTVQDIKELDAGSWYSPQFTNESIPLLREVIDKFGGKIGLLIEIKTTGQQIEMAGALSPLLLDSIEKGQLSYKNVKVQSFNVKEIEKFHQLAPKIATGLLLNNPLDTFQLTTYRQFTTFLSIHYYAISSAFIKQAEFYDYEIYSWTIKQQYQFYDMQRIGVHGIISDEEMKTRNTHFYALVSPLLKGQDILRTFFV